MLETVREQHPLDVEQPDPAAGQRLSGPRAEVVGQDSVDVGGLDATLRERHAVHALLEIWLRVHQPRCLFDRLLEGTILEAMERVERHERRDRPLRGE